MESIVPVSRDYGISQGGSIARRYIDMYVQEQISKINLYNKSVVEIGNDRYSCCIEGCKKIIIRNVVTDDHPEIHFADLETGEGCDQNIADLVILTNVLSCLYDVKAALKNTNKMLKKNGVAIITVPGIAHLCQKDYQTYGQFWRFTPKCLERLVGDTFDIFEYNYKAYGNVKAATKFLYGESVKVLSEEELMFIDEDYPMVIGATVKKC